MGTGIGIVQTKYGKLCGVRRQGHTVFRGIPYAKPPVGALRWKKPVPPESWNGVRDAKVFGATAMQRLQTPGSFYEKEFFSDEDFFPPMSEDCLFLNVWTPARAAGDKLPVAFWIHGGGFVGGYGTEPEFDGAAYCERGVILVSFNYRLGALGFLAHEWLSAESAKEGHGAHSGNYALYDQLAALNWVRENIAAFGGDPDKITIFGQSAGARSVQSLVSSPLTKGLIAGAILQSGGGYKLPISRDATLQSAEGLGARFAEACGADSLESLRALPVEAVMKASNELVESAAAKGQGFAFGPCIDGKFLITGSDDALESGLHADIPYMIGSAMNDFGVTRADLAAGKKNRLYQGCIEWSLLGESLGRKPSYVYYFMREPLGDDAGAFHSSELWYMFNTLSRSWRPKVWADYELAEKMTDYWCNFVKTGDPNGGGLPRWEPCAEKNGRSVRALREGM
ncbi:MAG: carboxylesterase family protein [Clostridiales bacterium]|jgi:para-nitrobenzyl esterase|nr:carboxylesterase family protein [Clostridiales bacterium]